MTASAAFRLPRQMASDLERRFFWWEPLGATPRSDLRIVLQAMAFASFAEVRRLEATLDAQQLVDAMLAPEPGWLDGRSWEFWRGRLVRATGRSIPDAPPRRSCHADSV